MRGPSGRGPVRVAIVLPCYNVGSRITQVLHGAPPSVTCLIPVDDASTDDTWSAILAASAADPRIVPVRHGRNTGVGGATVTGFDMARSLGAEIVVKMDGDGQMAWDDLPLLLAPLIHREADCTKGNRFHDLQALRRMPAVRRIGNLALSFLAKAATGYWSCFDPTNGFVAIRHEALARLSRHRLDRRYFFEHSLLAELYLVRAVVRDCPMPARYGEEPSHLSPARALFGFPLRLFRLLVRRVVLYDFIYNFSLEVALPARGFADARLRNRLRRLSLARRRPDGLAYAHGNGCPAYPPDHPLRPAAARGHYPGSRG